MPDFSCGRANRETWRATSWLAAGVMEKGRFAPTEEGTPQGGVVSPMLLNIALHGMEEAAGVRYTRRDPLGAHVARDSPVLVRYADDFVVMCHTRDQAEQVRPPGAARPTPADPNRGRPQPSVGGGAVEGGGPSS